MIITYFRSSSYNQYSMCPHAYYLTYVLGHQSPSGQAAEKGTIVHKVMECLAAAKLSHQNSEDSFEIDEPWAKYSYVAPDGTKLDGSLSMKGTIDLITEERPSVYEVIDWKTGRRLDWATGKEKDFKRLTTDPQLRIYHYALSKMYPDIDQFIMTIYFIKDGGPYTLAFTKDDMQDTLDMIRKRFEEIRDCHTPRLKKSWKCTKICHFGKNAHSSGIIDPETGEPFTICEYVAQKIRKEGLDLSLAEDMSPGHKFDYYQAPGG